MHRLQEQHNRASREALWEMIDLGRGRLGKGVNMLVFAMIIISLIILPLEFIDDLKEYHIIAEVIEIVVTAFFTVEYLLRIYAAPSRLRYIFSWWGLVDLLSILPYYIYKANTQAFRLVRLIRIVRVLKIAHMKSSPETERVAKEKARSNLELMKGEEIEQVVMKHPLFFVINLVIPLALGIIALSIMLFGNMHQISLTVGAVFFLLMLVFFYKAWLDYHYDVMYLTNYRLIFQNQHLFGKSSHHVEYPFITNIRPTHTGIISFLLGYGSIVIDTASDVSEIRHENIRKHEKIASCINEKCKLHMSGGAGRPLQQYPHTEAAAGAIVGKSAADKNYFPEDISAKVEKILGDVDKG